MEGWAAMRGSRPVFMVILKLIKRKALFLFFVFFLFYTSFLTIGSLEIHIFSWI